MTIRIALIGFGKIAREQHAPAIAGNPQFTLAAICTPGKDPELGVPWFSTAEALFEAMTGKLDAVAICTPPAARFAIACDAIRAGLDVLLEKPPATTLGELDILKVLAAKYGRSVYAAWHSQHSPGVAQAAATLAGQDIAELDIRWFEEVRRWHPGQEWIWRPGGFGIFDPGINALALACCIIDQPLVVREATLSIPANRHVPIAASIRFAGDAARAEMDWRPTKQEEWTIRVKTARGKQVELRYGGSELFIDDVEQMLTGPSSYPAIYGHFAELCAIGKTEIDTEPLRIVADIFLVGSFQRTESFD